MLNGLCASGAALALMLVISAAPGPELLEFWLICLSLSVVGQVFFSSQWDTLLPALDFVAMFWGPWHIRPRL